MNSTKKKKKNPKEYGDNGRRIKISKCPTTSRLEPMTLSGECMADLERSFSLSRRVTFYNFMFKRILHPAVLAARVSPNHKKIKFKLIKKRKKQIVSKENWQCPHIMAAKRKTRGWTSQWHTTRTKLKLKKRNEIAWGKPVWSIISYLWLFHSHETSCYQDVKHSFEPFIHIFRCVFFPVSFRVAILVAIHPWLLSGKCIECRGNSIFGGWSDFIVSIFKSFCFNSEWRSLHFVHR